MPNTEGDDAIDIGLEPLRYESLEHMAFDRQLHSRHARYFRGVAGGGEPKLLALDRAFACLDGLDLAAL